MRNPEDSFVSVSLNFLSNSSVVSRLAWAKSASVTTFARPTAPPAMAVDEDAVNLPYLSMSPRSLKAGILNVVGSMLYSAPALSAITSTETVPAMISPFLTVVPGTVTVRKVLNIRPAADSKRVVAISG